MSSRPDAALERFWSREWRASPVAIVAGLASFALYAATVSPFVSTADPAEFQALARTGGIAHAGYPTWVLLLQLAGALPVGTLPWRANLLTAAFGAIAVALLAYTAYRLTGRRAPALVAAGAFALGITAWNESTLAGVHAPTLALDAVLLLLALRYRWRPTMPLAATAGGLFGLGVTGHLTVLGLAPPLLLALVGGLRHAARPARHVAIALLALAAGLTPFTYLLASDRPEQPMNYLHDTLEPGEASFAVERPDFGQRVERLTWLLSGRQYMDADRRDLRTLGHRAVHVGSVLAFNDLPLVTGVLAVVGFVMLLRGGGAPALHLGTWFATALVLAGLGGTERTLHYFFQPCTWLLCVGLAVALAALVVRSAVVAALASAIVLVTPLVRLRIPEPPGPLARSAMWRKVWHMAPREWDPFFPDRRYDDYGRGVMRRLPANAVVLGGRWEECATLRYFEHGEPLRDDVDILYAGLRDPRLGRLRAEAERAGRPIFLTHPPVQPLAGARLERVWDSGWRELWQLVPDSVATATGDGTIAR